MKIYHYNMSGLYTRSSDARQDPLDPSRFLIPINATTVVPSAGILARVKYGIWDGSVWYESDFPPEGPVAFLDQSARRRLIKERIRKMIRGEMRIFTYNNNTYYISDSILEQLQELRDLIDLTQAAGEPVGGLFPADIVISKDNNGDEIIQAIPTPGAFVNLLLALMQHYRAKRQEGRQLIATVNAIPDGQVPMPAAWVDPRG